MKERDKLRNWDPGWRNQIRVQIMGDSNLVVNWLNGRRKVNNQKFRADVQKTLNLFDKTDIRPMADHLDLFQHKNRDWNEKADRLTHDAREKGASWNSFTVMEGSILEAVRACLQEDKKVKHKEGSAHVIQASETIEEAAEKMEWECFRPAQRCIVRELELQLQLLCKEGLFSNENENEITPPIPPSQICPLARQSYPYPCPRDENGATRCFKDGGWRGKASNQPSIPPGRSPVTLLQKITQPVTLHQEIAWPITG